MVNLYIKINFSPSSTELPPLTSRSQTKQFSTSGSFNIGFNSAFCVPSSCSPDEAMFYLNDALFLGPTMYEAVSAECQILAGPVEVETIDIITA